MSPLRSAAVLGRTPVALSGHAASSCPHSVALALIPGCPTMDLGCREGLQCQDGPFSKDRGASTAVGAAVSGALPCSTAWQEHRDLENRGFIEKLW